MLKIKDKKTGKIIAHLKDDDTEPEMLNKTEVTEETSKKEEKVEEEE